MLTADKLRAEVDVLVADLKTELDGKVFSDLVDLDEKGCIRYQYVDLVQEGGGVLGVALMGYCYVLEQMGIRFLSLSGTSAGAINTVLLAAAGRPHEYRVEQVLREVTLKNFRDFIDGNALKRWVLLRFLSGRSVANSLLKVMILLIGFVPALVWMSLWAVFKILSLLIGTPVPALLQLGGLNSGENFRHWVKRVLNKFGIDTTKDIEEKIQPDWDNLFQWGNNGKAYPIPEERRKRVKLALMSTEITTLTKVEFPDMSGLYFKNPEQVSPAEYVRASMSVPIFFKPYERDIRHVTADRDQYTALRRAKRFHYKGAMPEKVYFVDGGVLSNFPLDMLYEPGVVPMRPVFGVKLNYDDRIEQTGSQSLIQMALQTFDTARRLHDAEFLKTRPEYEPAIEYINTSDVSWLNFDLKDEEKKLLFRAGAEAAREFLRRFDWAHFKAHIEDKLIQETQNLLWTAWEKTEVFPDKIAFAPTPDAGRPNIRALRRELQTTSLQVLWVDDNPVNDLLEFYLFRYLDIEHDHARSTQEAMQLIREKGLGYYWLVVTDNTRGGNRNEGIELIRQLRESGYTGHIILSSKSYIDSLQTGVAAFPNDAQVTVLVQNSPLALMKIIAGLLENSGRPATEPPVP